MTEHKTIESPWTKQKYVVRELDPVILSVFSRPESQEVRNLRLKVQDTLSDLERERKRQEQSQKDQAKIDAIQAQLDAYYKELEGVAKLDEREIENRRKVLQYGLVQPKVRNEDDFLDLGKDASFIYSSIIAMSQVPEDYAEIIQGLFRPGEPAHNEGGKSG